MLSFPGPGVNVGSLFNVLYLYIKTFALTYDLLMTLLRLSTMTIRGTVTNAGYD